MFFELLAAFVDMVVFCDGITAATAPCSIKFCVLIGPPLLIMDTELEF